MANLFLVGDIHLGLGYPNKSSHWLKIHKEYFNDFLYPTLKRNVACGDMIVLMGDVFDNRNVVPINILNEAFDMLETLSAIAPVHVIVGNHDCWDKSTTKNNALRPFKHMPNVTIWDEPGVLTFSGKDILMLPYEENASKQVEQMRMFGKCDWLLCHSDLNGATMHLTSSGHRNNHKLGIDEFSAFEKVFSGHIHIQQEHKNFVYVGNVFHMDRNDTGDTKGIHAVDMSTGEQTFLPNRISPEFRKAYIRRAEDISEALNLPKKDWVDLVIYSSLMSDTKDKAAKQTKRRIEEMLMDNTHFTVQYYDDVSIKKTTEVPTEQIKKMIERTSVAEGDPEIALEYAEIIKNHIQSQRYPDDSLKEGILEAFSEVQAIYSQSQ